MFGDSIVEEHMCRAAGCPCDALRHRRIVRRHDVWSTRTDYIGCEERLNQICEPITVDAYVGVCIRYDVAARFGDADVSRCAETAVGNIDHPDAGMPMSNFAGAIPGPIVDEDDL